jgi:glutamine amidotransferase
MGWSQILFDADHPLLDGIIETSYFYFLHSYAVPPAEYTIATADHGVPFSAILAERNFFAAQFHPECSSVAGSRLLQNFVRL